MHILNAGVNMGKLFFLNFLFLLFIFSSLSCNEKNNPCNLCGIENHKKSFMEKISKDPLKRDNPQYLFSRVLLTIGADDCDYIPKVPQAGEVFEEIGYSYQLMHNGVKVLKDCYYDSWATDVIYGLKGHHEPQEEKVFYEVLKYIPPNATMIELGSYW